MDEYIALDSHTHYSLAEREEVRTGRTRQERIEHEPGAIREYLAECPAGTAVAAVKDGAGDGDDHAAGPGASGRRAGQHEGDGEWPFAHLR